MRNKEEFKALVEERAAAQRQAAVIAARRRKTILAGVAALVLCLTIVPLAFGLFSLPANESNGGPGEGGPAMNGNMMDKYSPDLETDHAAEDPALDDTPNPGRPGDSDEQPDEAPSTTTRPEENDPLEPDTITETVQGITAVNRLVGLTPEAVDDRTIDKAFEAAYMDFAVKLFRGSNEIKDEDNLFFSPLSAMLALAMTANGAEGETLAEMESLLCGELSIEELNATLRTWIRKMIERQYSKSVFHAANSIWVREGVFNTSPAFLQTNANYYKTDFYEAPFNDSTVDDINLWIKHHTGGLIEKMLDEIGNQTMMYLINTLYLEAAWGNSYNDQQLSEGIFHGTKNDIDVTMMSSAESTYLFMEGAEGFTKHMDGYTFAALLPNEGTDMGEFVASLTGEQLQAFLSSGTRADVYAKIPSFSCDSSISLTEVLQPYIPTAMHPLAADFSKMGETIDGNTLFIGSVRQDTTITLDQNGILAAAATIVGGDTGSPPPEDLPEYHITLDRPFVYVILDNTTDLPVFIGVVEQL